MNKVCEICGKEKPLSEFSKSYKNRCKECVAEMTRENRRAEKEFKEIRQIKKELGWDKDDIDWQQVRIQAAISAMQGMYSNKEFDTLSFDRIAQKAVNQADALIAELKKKGELYGMGSFR